MIDKILKKIWGSKSEREIKKLQPIVDAINAAASDYQKLTDDELRAKTNEFRSLIKEREEQGEELQQILDDLLVDAFAVVREASWRVLGNKSYRFTIIPEEVEGKVAIRQAKVVANEEADAFEEKLKEQKVNYKRERFMVPFDVQVIGGIILHKGKIAEMKTGEGKTLVATMPVYLNALTGRGVHVVTVNDYLATRDSEWMGRVYNFLDMTVGCLDKTEEHSEERVLQYQFDITYGTNNQFGFDYLRDNMATRKEHCVQRNFYYAIIDEVDNILIDEARTPHIISGPSETSTDKYKKVNAIVPRLDKGEVIKSGKPDVPDTTTGDYTVDEKSHTVTLTEDGVLHCEKLLNIPNLYEDVHSEWVHHIIQALKAHSLFKRDTDYVVKDGQVIIVDEFTGRMMEGRRWSEGLHQAIEAKENLKVAKENQTLASITLQNYFRKYDKIAGMTGTAETEATEFDQIYGLDVTVIPTNEPLGRIDYPDEVYRTERERDGAVVNEIVKLSSDGRPILVGTSSIEKSEQISSMLKREGIKHSILNAKHHASEADIVAQAGRKGAVTIATNMAGRGTDIVLGGNSDLMLKHYLRKKGKSLEDLDKKEYEKIADKFKNECRKEHEEVVNCGGLHIIGTERHESRRIDNQLRGRAGRQGDPGSSKFFLALDDKLMRIFGGERIQRLMERMGAQDGDVISHPLVNRSIASAQRKVEAHNFEIRKHLLEYDDVINQQREAIYALRRQCLDGESLKDEIMDRVNDTIEGKVRLYCPEDRYVDEWNFGALFSDVKRIFGVEWKLNKDIVADKKTEDIIEELKELVKSAFQEKEDKLTSSVMRELERSIMLFVIDSRWKDHLLGMDDLKDGIYLRGYGQKDPLVEYKHEAFRMFEEMLTKLSEEVTEYVFRTEAVSSRREDQPLDFVHDEVSAFNMNEITTNSPSSNSVRRPTPSAKRVGRNDPCPCGSGKKFKKCCGKDV